MVGEVVKKGIVSPVLTVHWGQTHEPSFEYKDEGEYYIKVVLDPNNPTEQAFMDMVDEALEAAFQVELAEMKPAAQKKATKTEAYSEILDEDGNDTGLFSFKAGTVAVIQTKRGPWDKTPPIYDSKGVKITGKRPAIGKGSKVRVSFDLASYTMKTEIGLSRRLQGIQLLELVQGGGQEVKFGDMSEEYDYSAEPENEFVGDRDEDGNSGGNTESPDF